jgi:nucleotide-binding universal stress UspA family protein
MSKANVRSFRDILVYLSVGENSVARLGAAVELAKLHEARLVGVDVTHPSVCDTDAAPAAAGLAETFLREARAAGLECDFRVARRADATGWKALYAHYADIVVAPSAAEADARVALRGVPEDVLLHAGVPVLIIPDLWKPQPLGQSVVVAWNASREATRAVHDALPILTRADKVLIFGFDPRNDVMTEETGLLQAHLATHGIDAQPYNWRDTGEIEPEDALFSCLSEEDADLIVAGGYGHSRTMERLMGGMTRTLVKTVIVPVMLSH